MRHKSKALKCYFSWTNRKPLGHIGSVKNQLIKVAVIGARGYTGIELSKILLQHPLVDYKKYFYSPGREFTFDDLGFNQQLYKSLPKACSVEEIEKLNLEVLNDIDVVFLATPNEVSMELVPKILKSSAHIIDLSGIFRLDYENQKKSIEVYQKFYKIEHSNPENITGFQYGLVPFEKISKIDSRVCVANPGCYVSSVLLALKPLLSAGLIESENIVIDAKSGTSGAGKKAAENLLFSEIYNECLPYKVSGHQHGPEIQRYLEKSTGKQVRFSFTPHLMPFHRGIISSIYAKPSKALRQLRSEDKAIKIHQAYEEAFANYPLVRWDWMKKSKTIVNMKYVVGTPLTQIGYEFDDENVYLFSQLDNLMKGAASQAVENLNLIYNLKPETGFAFNTEKV